LEKHIRHLSEIGSRFQIVEKGPGIRPNPDETEELRAVNRKLKPLGLAYVTGKRQERKLQYLEGELTKLKIPSRRMEFETSRYGKGVNLIAEITGEKFPVQVLDITAHYDTYPNSPGADDNNSGVAGVLEIARIVKGRNGIERTVRLVFFDLEEQGLIGSRAYLERVKSGRIPRPVSCLNLEMIGYFSDLPGSQDTPSRIPVLFDPPRVGNTIVTVGNFRSYRWGRRLDGIFDGYAPDLPVFRISRWGDLMGNASRSDHYSYWEAGIPAVMLTDTANFRNPNYHKASDLPETVDFERIAKVTRGAAAYVLDWCSDR
jgi:Zn-dependent M28 family amino/carboxypeptidase